jgi:uncharacterized integral membrane protein
MRGITTVLGIVLLAALAVGVILFAVGNPANATYSLAGNTFTMPIWLPVALAAVLGALLTLLTLSPAVGASRTNALEREHRVQVDRQLTEQRTANEALQARVSSLEGDRDTALQQRDDAVKDREGVQARAERAEAAAMAAIHSGSTDVPARDAATTEATTDTQAPARTDTAMPAAATRETTGTPTGQTPTSQTPTDGAADERQFEMRRAQNPPPEERPRGPYDAPERANDPNAMPDNQPPATA